MYAYMKFRQARTSSIYRFNYEAQGRRRPECETSRCNSTRRNWWWISHESVRQLVTARDRYFIINVLANTRQKHGKTLVASLRFLQRIPGFCPLPASRGWFRPRVGRGNKEAARYWTSLNLKLKLISLFRSLSLSLSLSLLPFFFLFLSFLVALERKFHVYQPFLLLMRFPLFRGIRNQLSDKNVIMIK